MHMFADERPKTLSGHMALLHDNSAMPVLYIRLLPQQKITLTALLPCYDTHGGYSYNDIEIFDSTLPALISHYRENPEDFFFLYFKWKAQVVINKPKPTQAVRPKASAKEAFEYIQYVEDLL